MKGYIYEFRNKIDGKFYVGQTIYLERRFNTHKEAKTDNYFHRTIRYYGFENFEFTVVSEHEHDNEKQLRKILNKEEKKRIKFRDCIAPKGYNMTKGGGGGNTLLGYSDEEYKKHCDLMRRTQQQRWLNEEEHERYRKIMQELNKKPEYHESLSKSQLLRYSDPKAREEHAQVMQREDVRRKIGIASKNMWRKPKIREKISIAVKKRFEDPDFRKAQVDRMTGKNNPNYGKPRSDETKRKISEAHKNIPKTHLIGNTNTKGRLWYNNGVKQKLIKKEEVESYEKMGWKHGALPLSEETKKKISTSVKKTMQSHEIKEKCSKGGKSNVGRHCSKETKKKISVANKGKLSWSKGTIWITNDIEERMILLDVEIPNGWHKGRLKETNERISKTLKEKSA